MRLNAQGLKVHFKIRLEALSNADRAGRHPGWAGSWGQYIVTSTLSLRKARSDSFNLLLNEELDWMV